MSKLSITYFQEQCADSNSSYKNLHISFFSSSFNRCRLPPLEDTTNNRPCSVCPFVIFVLLARAVRQPLSRHELPILLSRNWNSYRQPDRQTDILPFLSKTQWNESSKQASLVSKSFAVFPVSLAFEQLLQSRFSALRVS